MGMIIAVIIAVLLLNIGEKNMQSDDTKKVIGGFFSSLTGTIMGVIIIIITIIAVGSL